MATPRLLSLLATATFLGVLTAGQVAAQATPVPRWVRVSAASGNVAKLSIKLTDTAASASKDTPFKTAWNVGDTALAARNVFHDNARLLGNRREARPALLGRYSAQLKTVGNMLAVATTTYDLANGNLSASQAGRNAVQIVASTTAATVTCAAMMSMAGFVGTASTGTAIATLSGAAYTSAATAWWGGGALAAGGGGMAFGSVVLTGGAIVIATVVVVGVYKVWNYLDPATRDAMHLLAVGCQGKADLTDVYSTRGAALLTEKRLLAHVEHHR